MEGWQAICCSVAANYSVNCVEATLDRVGVDGARERRFYPVWRGDSFVRVRSTERPVQYLAAYVVLGRTLYHPFLN